MIGEEKLLKFSGVALGEACTVVLRGATQQILDEAERSMHDALCVLAQTVKETRTVFGGGLIFLPDWFLFIHKLSGIWKCCVSLTGCSEMLMANAVSLLAAKTPGKEAVAIESFAKALRMVCVLLNCQLYNLKLEMCCYNWCSLFQLPTIIADNAGYDSSDLVSQLRAAHTEGKSTFGLGQLPIPLHIQPYLNPACFSGILWADRALSNFLVGRSILSLLTSLIER